jgi:hypothetical protein
MTRWHSVSGDEAQTLEHELARELPAGHALKGVKVRAVARRLDRDDVAFELEDGRCCVVHLTWNVETDPRWPHSELVSVLPEDDE